MDDFVHLHVHTVYSFLDGLTKPRDLAQACKDMGMKACAVTDHNHMGGSLRAYREMKKAGVKPILGMEITIGKGHLILLAENKVGYRRLMDLATKQAHGPLVFSDLKDGYGLTALTGCIRGHYPSAIADRDDDKAYKILKRLRSTFDHVFVELQFHGPMAVLAPQMSRIAQQAGVDIVATNDVHYLKPEDHNDQNVLMAIRQNKKSGDRGLFQHPKPEYYLRSPREMWDISQARFFRKALENTLFIADYCKVDLDLDKPDLPSFTDDEDSELSRLAKEGFKKRGMASGEPAMRLVHELAVIQEMGFSGYFLIVQDFVNWARENGVAVAPGRGSGAGSLVAYCLGITDIDPVANGLYFERFLNPERVSMPDFDIDFAQGGRKRVIEYVRHKYGSERVGQIATYMTLNPKSAIKDVARVLGLPFSEVNDYTKIIPSNLRPKTEKEKSMDSFDFALTFAPELTKKAKTDAAYGRVLQVARKLTGCCRQTGKHAGGVVIGRRPLENYTPLTKDGLTMYDKKDVEAAGLVKFDFLGVKTLDVIDMTAKSVGVNVRELQPNDEEVLQTIGAGNTWGLFQVESPGMEKMCKDLEIDVFEDIVAAVALYRPGPKESGMLDEFIHRKHGRSVVEYPHPTLKEILEETYGTIVYQEQVMRTAQILAGYSLGGADLLRRAMGKKIESEMRQQRRVFIDGCLKNNVDKEIAESIFEAIGHHAAYSFNKSHAAAYAMITYHTAFLKHYYPKHFVASLLTIECQVQEVLSRYAREARAHGVQLLPPHVNNSRDEFVVEDGAVRWGLSAVKGIGDVAVKNIVDHQPYTDFADLVKRTTIGSGPLEALVASGACDCFEQDRATLYGNIRLLVKDRRRDGQCYFLEPKPEYIKQPPWTEEERLSREYNHVGHYFSGHPVSRATKDTPSTHDMALDIEGVVVDVFEKKSDKGLWAKVVIEDAVTHKTCLIMADVYKNLPPLELGCLYRFEVDLGDDVLFTRSVKKV